MQSVGVTHSTHVAANVSVCGFVFKASHAEQPD